MVVVQFAVCVYMYMYLHVTCVTGWVVAQTLSFEHVSWDGCVCVSDNGCVGVCE